jgi:hypothetical protein
VQHNIGRQGVAQPPDGHSRSGNTARAHGRSNASIYFSSRSLPVCEESIPGAGKRGAHQPINSAAATSTEAGQAGTNESSLPWQSSLEYPVESVNSIGSTAGGLAGAPVAGVGSGCTATTAYVAVPAAAANGGDFCRASDIL